MKMTMKKELRTAISRQSLKHSSKSGSMVVEYAMIMAIIVCGVAAIFAPRRDSPVYDAIRDAHRRALVFIGVPLL